MPDSGNVRRIPEGITRTVLTLVLVLVSAAMLFVPVVEGADDVRAMFLLLTGIAVRDYFSATFREGQEKRANELASPTPGRAYIPGDE